MTEAHHRPIRVFLLDDHEVVRRGIKDLLEGEGDIVVVGESGPGPGGGPPHPGAAPGRGHPRRPAARRHRASTCAGRSGPRTRRINALILTSYDDDDALFSAIMAGASGYVLKQIRGTDLVDTVRRVAAGQSMLDPAVTAQVLDRLRSGPKTDPALDQLTAQELQDPRADRPGHDQPADRRAACSWPRRP